jgi:hypothetical protein
MASSHRAEIVNHTKVKMSDVKEEARTETSNPADDWATAMSFVDRQINHPSYRERSEEWNENNQIMAVNEQPGHDFGKNPGNQKRWNQPDYKPAPINTLPVVEISSRKYFRLYACGHRIRGSASSLSIAVSFATKTVHANSLDGTYAMFRAQGFCKR